MIISAILKPDVPIMWDAAAPFIDKAWDEAPGYYRSIDVLDRILNDLEVMWGVFDDDLRMIGCFTTSIETYPRSRILLISCLAGEKIDEWYEDAMNIVKRFAKDQGCSKLEAKGRKGWLRYAKQTGWKETASVYQCDLKED